MAKLSKLSRTDVSAIVSVALFSLTILISAVGPAEAQDSVLIHGDTTSPSVSYKA